MIGGGLGSKAVSFAAKKVAKVKDQAEAEREFTTRVLARFAEDLERGVDDRVLRRGDDA